MTPICYVFRQQNTLGARRISISGRGSLGYLYISKEHLSHYRMDRGSLFRFARISHPLPPSIPLSPHLSLSHLYSHSHLVSCPFLALSLFITRILSHTATKRYTHRESNNSWRAVLR